MSFKYEVKALYELNDWKYSPKIHDAWTCGEYGYLVVDKLEANCYHSWKIINEILRYYHRHMGYEWRDIKKILQSLKRREWYHGDTHSGNVMCDKHGTKKLIDFGWARKFQRDNEIYADHPLRKFHFLEGVDRALLEATQDANVEIYYGTNQNRMRLADVKVGRNVARLKAEGFECDC